MDSQTRTSLKLMLIVQLTGGFRGGMISPILALFIRKQGFTLTEIGFLGTIEMVGWLIFEPITGMIADKAKKKWLMVISIVSSTFVLLAFPLATGFWQFALLMFGRSSTASLNAVSVKAIVAELLPAAGRGKAYGRYLATVSTGGIVAPFVGGLLSAITGYMIVFYIAAGVGILSLGSTLLLRHDEKAYRRATATATTEDTRLMTEGFIGILVVRGLYMVNHVLRVNFLPIFLHESPSFEATETEIGTYMSITQLTAALSHALLGSITDKAGTRTMMAASLSLEGLGYFALTITTGIPSLYVLGAIHGTASSAADLSMMIHLMQIMPKDKTGIVMGLYSEAENIGATAFSPVFGTTYDTMGPIFAIRTVSLLLIANSALSAGMLGTRKTRPTSS